MGSEEESELEGSWSKELDRRSGRRRAPEWENWARAPSYVLPNLSRSPREEYAYVLQDYNLEKQKLCQVGTIIICPAQTWQFSILNWLNCAEKNTSRKGEGGHSTNRL